MNAAYMRFLIHSINNSAFSTPPELPTWDGPPKEIVVAVNLLYASLVTSLFAAFVAMLGKQWVNRYTRNKGGSIAERCGDRQRKLNGLHRWRFHILMESLPVALQFALLLLGCGLSQYMWVVNQTIAGIIMGGIGFGILFYIAIVIAGTISYECPFQTPLSLVFRAFGAHRSFSYLRTFLYTRINSISSFLIGPRSRPTVRTVANGSPRSLDVPTMEHLFFSEGGLLKPDRMRFDRRRNLLDALCVSWTLDTITDPEVMDAALYQFMSIQWHAGVPPAASPHQLTALYRDCFDYRNTLLPGSRDRAYASGRALVHFYVQNLCVSRDMLSDFDLPTDLPTFFTGDADTVSLSSILTGIARGNPFQGFYLLEGMSTNHLCWISDLSLCLNWVHWQQPLPSTIDPLSLAHQVIAFDGAPKYVLFDCMLIIGMSLGLQVTVDDLFIADKVYVLTRSTLAAFILTGETVCRNLVDLAIKVTCERMSVAIRSGDIDVLPTLECLGQWKHERYSLVTFVIHWCNAVRESGRSDQEATEVVRVVMRIGFRQYNKPQAVVRKHPSQILGYILHSLARGDWDEDSMADALLAYVTFIGDPEDTQGILVDTILLAADLTLTPRLATAMFYAMGVAGFSAFERRGVDRLVYLTTRLGHIPNQILTTPHFTLYWSTFICDWVASPSRLFLPDNYMKVLFALTCTIPLEGKMATIQLSEPVTSSVCDVAYDLERWAQWDKLEYWLEIVWLTSPELLLEQWDWIEKVTLNSVRRRPALSTDFRDWITITRTAYLEHKFGASARFENIATRLVDLDQLLDAEDTQKNRAEGEIR